MCSMAVMADEVKVKSYMVNVADHMIEMWRPTDAQLMLIGRIGRKLNKLSDGTPEEGTAALLLVGQLLDIIESMIVKPEDRELVEELITDREVELSHLSDALGAFFAVVQNEANQSGPVTNSVSRL
jgi:hypothetical protein